MVRCCHPYGVRRVCCPKGSGQPFPFRLPMDDNIHREQGLRLQLDNINP
ncbi:hypothetical protein ISS37_04135 [candidate division KSB1 bacterium]|nr:hypothetical protein [candidate division KSB1 bacterium]